MSYRIRYGLERRRRFPWLRMQAAGSAILLVVLAAGKAFGAGEGLEAVFCPGDTLVETLTVRMAREIAAGEGWYLAFARFCGGIINGAA